MGIILKNNIIKFSILSIILFLSILVSSAPPFIPSETLDYGLVIEYPVFNYLKEGEDFSFHFHLFNQTGTNYITTGATCYFHLYNSLGRHIFVGFDNTVEEIFDYSFDVAGGNFTPGIYGYVIQCNTSNQVGYTEKAFEVTATGSSFDSAKSILYIGLLGILVFILISTFFGMNYLPASNVRDEEGKILSINYLKYLRLPLWLFAYFIFIAIVFLSSNLAYAFLNEVMFGKILFSVFSILMALSPVIVIVLVISFFIKFFHDKQFQNMLNRGMFPGGNF